MTPPPDSPGAGPRGPAAILALLALVLTWALCYLPGLTTAELEKEEARRAVPAREMLESGDFVVPTVWERTYLAKPPLLFWTIAALGAVHGQVDELTARLPSALATLLLALCLWDFGRRRLGPHTGLVAGLLLLVTPGMLGMGMLGELEASLTLYVFLATAGLWSSLEAVGARGRWLHALGAGLALAAAMMTKGPVALLFFGAALAAAVVARRSPRVLLAPACWLPLVLSLATIGTWAALVLARVDSDAALGLWGGELARANDSGLGRYLEDRQKLISGVLVGFFPGSLLCLAAWPALLGRTKRGAALSSAAVRPRPNPEPALRFLALAVVISLAFFLLQPGARTRFTYPALPWCVLLAAHLLTQALADPSSRQRTLRASVGVVALLGSLLTVGGLALHLWPLAELEPFDLAGHGLLVVLAVAVAASLGRLRGPVTVGLLVAPLTVLAAARLVQTTQLERQASADHPKQAFGAQLDALVPEGEAIDLRFWGGFNELSYAERRLVHSELGEPLGDQRFVLALVGDVEGLRTRTTAELVEVAPLQLIKGAELRLLELR